MDAAAIPCEMFSQPDYVTVVFRPGISQATWTEVENFGAEVRDELQRRDPPVCLIDLSPMNYMGSAIVALIVRLWKVVQSHDGRMVVLCPNPAVLEVIRLAGLDKIWTIAPDRVTAERDLGLAAHGDGHHGVAVTSSSIRLWYFVLGVVSALLVLMLVLLFAGDR